MATALTECIRDGTFPDSNDTLSEDVTSEGILLLLKSLEESQNVLKREIGDSSQNVAVDVDEWIAQARKLQEDIAQCKIEARHIVEEHERGKSLRSSVQDANSKTQLLETEIAFTRSLEHEIQTISEVTQVLNDAEHDLSISNPVSTVDKLASIEVAIDSISAGRSRSLLSQLDRELRERARKELEQLLNSRWTMTRSEKQLVLTTQTDANLQQSAEPGTTTILTDNVLSAIQKLQALPIAVALVLRTIESFIFSAFSMKSPPFLSSVHVENQNITITKTDTVKDTHKALASLRTVFEFLHHNLPIKLRDSIAHELLPKVISSFISRWLDVALPHNLYELQNIEPLHKEVLDLATMLQNYAWPGDEALKEWVDQIPRNWLGKRKVASLEAVRTAFSLAHGVLRPVERSERQIITLKETKETVKDEDDDWNANWDDEPKGAEKDHKQSTGGDDVSGWDFDTEDNQSDEGQTHNKIETETRTEPEEDDAGDAWGWGDDDNVKEDDQEPKPLSPSEAQHINGDNTSAPTVQEMVLTEAYHITDIPEYILEIIGKDMADSHELQVSAENYFGNNSPATGLAGLPNQVLALFRATAPTYYSLPSAKYTLTNINLYNDILYLIQKLTESPDSQALQSSIQSLTKFAKQVYSSELDVQRTILADLLDGAQGFERCTTFPNSQACTDAVASTVDRLRQLHKEWSSILGESHLLQSIGSLLTMILGKIIKDIEDMDDISEAESKQLVTFSQQILSLEDLFTSRLPDLTSQSQHSAAAEQSGETQAQSQILLYVPNYLRFQYLQQILESSLVDIKYLWTEGELSLEFSVDEVHDLIKALFAESQYRRDAIRAIK